MCEMLKKRECRAVKKYIFDENLYTLLLFFIVVVHTQQHTFCITPFLFTIKIQ